jgi:hypothetical protein
MKLLIDPAISDSTKKLLKILDGTLFDLEENASAIPEKIELDFSTLESLAKRRETGIKNDKEAFDEFVKTFDANKPQCIIQEIDFQEWDEEQREKFFLTEKRTISKSNPLFYRRALFEFKLGKHDTESFAMSSIPIIYLGNFALFDQNILGNNGTSERIYSPKHNSKLFLDSGIWHHYLPLWEVDEIQKILKDIHRCYEKKIYRTTVALEHLDFSIRTLKSNYIEDFGAGSHGGKISLHSFHSENRLKYSVEKLPKPKKEDKILRVLLIDDYAKTPLQPCGENIKEKGSDSEKEYEENKKSREKETLICSVLGGHIVVDCAENFQDALDSINKKGTKIELKNKTYDIILLDHLFTNNQPDGKTHYSSEFLELLTNKFDDLKKGPGGKFWILPVSVFVDAVKADITSSNISETEKEYTIITGADPVCTPQLFLWKFYTLAKQISEELLINPAKDLISDMLKELGFCEIIPMNKQAYKVEFENSLIYIILEKYYAAIVLEHGKFVQLKNDAKIGKPEEGSLFAKYLFEKYYKLETKGDTQVGLLRKVQNFLHTFLYGSNQDWGILLAEFLVLKDIYSAQEYQDGIKVLESCIDDKAERG